MQNGTISNHLAVYGLKMEKEDWKKPGRDTNATYFLSSMGH